MEKEEEEKWRRCSQNSLSNMLKVFLPRVSNVGASLASCDLHQLDTFKLWQVECRVTKIGTTLWLSIHDIGTFLFLHAAT